MTHNELRQKFLAFFENRGHLVLPGAPLVPVEDDSTLFTTAGVQPLVPYLKQEKVAPSKRLANVQKCLRTNDMDEVGDQSHLTFFEMLGSWSIGGYGKKESITYAHDFLMSPDGLNLPKDRIWVTVFKGGNGLPKDEESAGIWQSLGIPAERTAYLPESDNWWSMGEEGLCGPDTEIFYDLQYPEPVPEGQNPGNDPDGRFIEIWNTVFMSYEQKNGILHELPTQNIDEGAGLERLLFVVNGKSIYETSCFQDSCAIIRSKAGLKDAEAVRKSRIVADHLRTILFILSETPFIYPSATAHGYILRKLIRSAVKNGNRLGLTEQDYEACLKSYACAYQEQYPETGSGFERKMQVFNQERERFEKILLRAPGVWDQLTGKLHDKELPPEIAFKAVTEQGIPIEVIEDLVTERLQEFNRSAFEILLEQHRRVSGVSRKSKPENNS